MVVWLNHNKNMDLGGENDTFSFSFFILALSTSFCLTLVFSLLLVLTERVYSSHTRKIH